MSQTKTHTRGGTFSLTGTATLPAGTWTATASLRNQRGVLVEDLAVELTAPQAPETDWTIVLEATAAATELWPVGQLQGDVRFQDDSGVVVYTSEFIVNVREHHTNAPA